MKLLRQEHIALLTISLSRQVQQNEGLKDQSVNPYFSLISPVQAVLSIQWPSEHSPLVQNEVFLEKK